MRKLKIPKWIESEKMHGRPQQTRNVLITKAPDVLMND